jgi:hypothetical protein
VYVADLIDETLGGISETPVSEMVLITETIESPDNTQLGMFERPVLERVGSTERIESSAQVNN